VCGGCCGVIVPGAVREHLYRKEIWVPQAIQYPEPTVNSFPGLGALRGQVRNSQGSRPKGFDRPL